MKRRGQRPAPEGVYLLLRGPEPGLYTRLEAEARAFWKGEKGALVRAYKNTEEAWAALRKALAKGGLVRTEGGQERRVRDLKEVRLPDLFRPVYHARTDGSFKEGEAASWAALISEDGKTLAHGSLAYPRGTGAGDAEAKALLLALLLAPRGVALYVGTDHQGLVDAWERKGKVRGLGLAPLVKAVEALAQAFDLEIRLYKVPRKEVQMAHDGAQAARKERPRVEGAAQEAYALLERLPARYRMAALTLLEGYRGEAEDLLPWLARGRSPTYSLLREALAPLGRERVARVLQGVRSLPKGVREALKGKDWFQARDEAMAQRPPTERQLELLARLGYGGPPPEDRLTASRLISALLGEEAWGPGQAPGERGRPEGRQGDGGGKG